jgi:hypothetical protein
MKVKVILTVLGLVLGCWMVFDGLHVLWRGKYFGPEKPGPWASLVAGAGMDPFRLGIPFIVLGITWIAAVALLLLEHRWAWAFGIGVSLATLWYLPVGTVLSLLFLTLLALFRERL